MLQWPFSSTSYLIYYSLIVLTLNATNRILYPIVCEKCQSIRIYQLLWFFSLGRLCPSEKWQRYILLQEDPTDHPTYHNEGKIVKILKVSWRTWRILNRRTRNSYKIGLMIPFLSYREQNPSSLQRLILFRKVNCIFTRITNHTKHINTLCERNSASLYLKNT